MKKIGIVLFLVLNLTSCVVVKEYEKVYVNDAEMELASKSIERSETNAHLYREGAAGANGGKTGGGCGCN